MSSFIHLNPAVARPSPVRVYRKADIDAVLRGNRQGWRLAQSTTTSDFITLLTDKSHLRRADFRSESDYPAITRFVWGPISPYQLALSLKPDSCLCHGTAVFLHQLNDQIPSTIYVNDEQSPKPSSSSMTQMGMNRAFVSAPRTSNYVFSHDGRRYVILNGKSTAREGVITLDLPDIGTVAVTSIERTLIDITVRPRYAGGVYQVKAAFEGARERVSVGRLIAMLRTINQAYPYHQAIGFYMKAAGYPPTQTDRLEDFVLPFDFHLTHQMKAPAYDKDWRLFHPSGM